MWLDDKSKVVSANSPITRSTANTFICILPDKTTTPLLQLEARPRSRSDGYLYSELGSSKGICQPPVVPDLSVPESNKTTTCKSAVSDTALAIPALIPSHSWDVRDYPRQLPHHQNIILTPTNQEFTMKKGVPMLVTWPVSGIPLHHKEFLHKLQSCSMHHGEAKPTVVTTGCSQNGLAGVHKGVEIPLLDLYKM